MTIQAGTDPDSPIPLQCSIRSTGELEIKYGSSSLTHPSTVLLVDLDDLDHVTFQTSDFDSHEVEATTIGGDDWTDHGTTVTSEELAGGADPGVTHDIKVNASNGGTPKTATIQVRIREQNANPLPSTPGGGAR
jgi:hypothetical protein